MDLLARFQLHLMGPIVCPLFQYSDTVMERHKLLSIYGEQWRLSPRGRPVLWTISVPFSLHPRLPGAPLVAVEDHNSCCYNLIDLLR